MENQIEAEKETENIIEIKGLQVAFNGNHVLRGIDLEIKKGEIMTLIGASGTGKSVLLRSIIGLLHPDSGSIYFEGNNIVDYTEDEYVKIRKHIAMLFQGGALFDSLTILENVCYPLREHMKLSEEEIVSRSRTLLSELGLKGTEDKHPADLSGGMKRRVGIARSIVLEPDVILFDEPTTGLDPANTRNLCEIITRLNQKRGITCMIVTHDIETSLKITHRMAMIHEGKIAIAGTKEEVLKSEDPLVKSFISGEILADSV